MANPNLLNITSITGHSGGDVLSTTGSNIVSAAANTLVKVISLYCTNTTTATSSISLTQSGRYIVFGLDLPPDSTVQLVTKDAPLYITDGEVLTATSAASNTINCHVYYEVMS